MKWKKKIFLVGYVTDQNNYINLYYIIYDKYINNI